VLSQRLSNSFEATACIAAAATTIRDNRRGRGAFCCGWCAEEADLLRKRPSRARPVRTGLLTRGREREKIVPLVTTAPWEGEANAEQA